jgi:hypothetical protein
VSTAPVHQVDNTKAAGAEPTVHGAGDARPKRDHHKHAVTGLVRGGVVRSAVVPGAGDDAIIADGATITIDAAGAMRQPHRRPGRRASCSSGETARQNQCGQRHDRRRRHVPLEPLRTVTTHLLFLAGSLTINGTLDRHEREHRGAAINFTGAPNATFGGTGATTDIFGPLTVSSPGRCWQLNPTAFTFRVPRDSWDRRIPRSVARSNPARSR